MTTPEQPLVSVVIPTRNRPELVLRAVRSALGQTWTNLEVVVVVDGPDPATVAALQAVEDSRVRVVALEQSVGGSEARNVAVRHAEGTWVALLDDDDEWMPEKIRLQFEQAASMHSKHVFVGSRYLERSGKGDRVLPKVLSNPKSHVSELLFYRKSFNSGTGYVQTSTWFIDRALLLEVPFMKGLRRNQDGDWMLRALTHPEVSIAVLPEPLVIFFEDDRPERVSKKADWHHLYEWAMCNRAHFTRRALSFFLLTSCVQDASTQKESPNVIWFLLKESFRLGAPTPLALVLFFYYWLLPDSYRRAWRMRHQEARACA